VHADAAQLDGNSLLPRPRSNSVSWQSVAITTFIFGAILAWSSPWQTFHEARAAPVLPRMDGPPTKIIHRLIAFERTARRITERRLASARNELLQERTLRAVAEQTTEELTQKLSNERRAKDLAESDLALREA
jgi:hypothetical protein